MTIKCWAHTFILGIVFPLLGSPTPLDGKGIAGSCSRDVYACRRASHAYLNPQRALEPRRVVPRDDMVD